MTDDRSLERAARSWLEEGPTRATDRPVEAALTRIQTTPQERDLRVPWRLPDMTPLKRVATVAVLGAAAIGVSLFLLGRGVPNVGGEPTSSPVPSAPGTAVPSITPDPSAMQAFRVARDFICVRAGAQADPLQGRFLGIFDGSISQAQRDDWIAALEDFVILQGHTTNHLAALTPPVEIADANAENIAIFRDLNDRVLSIATHLRRDDDAAAQEVDSSTNQLGALIADYEVRNSLVGCP